MKIENLTSWESFLAVARLGSFTKAATELRLNPSQLSKRIANLEENLGARLFQRSTRVVTLTDEGRSLIPKIESILDDLESVESSFADPEQLTGTVRITAVPFVAHRLLIPVLKGFFRKYPDIHVELELSKSFVNLIEAGFDMAIRIETPKDSELVYRRIAPNDLVLCASPDYLERKGEPLQKPQDLEKHDLLVLNIHHRCRFQNSPTKLGDFTASKRVTCGNGVFLTDMALKGGGVLVRSIWDVEPHFASGALVPVLQDHPLETFGYIHAVIPTKRYLAPRVKALLELIMQEGAKWTGSGI